MVQMEQYTVFCRPVLSALFTPLEYLPTLIRLGPRRFRRFIVDHLPWKNVRRLRDIVDVMYETSTNILDAKKRALQEDDDAVMRQIGRGQDIISVLSTYNSSDVFPLAY
jgi:hypothetical protein